MNTNRPSTPSVHQPPSATNPLRSLYPASLLFGQQREPCPWSKATASSPLPTCQVLLAVLMGEKEEGGDNSQPAGSSTCLPASLCQPLRLSLSSASLPPSQDSQQVSLQNGDLSEPPRRSNSSRPLWLFRETERSHISTHIHGDLFPQSCRKSHRSDSLLYV